MRVICTNMRKSPRMKAKDAFIFNLKHILYVNEMSQTELAAILAMSRQQVSNMMSGKNFVSETTLARLSKALKIEETDLFNPDFQDKYKKKP